MKKILIDLIKKHFNQIIENWTIKLIPLLNNKISNEQAEEFAKSSLKIVLEILEASDFTVAGQYLINNYTLFSKANLSILEISQLFSQGRYSILPLLENDPENDPVIVLGYLDDVFEQLFARYGMLHQEAKLREVEVDRVKDSTEVKRLQAQVDQSEKLAVIGQLAAGVAHEIGNPLTSISALVQIMQRRSKDEFISEQLSIVKENIDRISRIVRELVDFSRPPSYEVQLHDITDVIRTAVGIVKYDKRVKKVKFETDLKSGLPVVEIAPDQILQVFVNILINALDAMEGNGILKVKSSYDDDFVYVDIVDNGCGMDAKVVDQIFDPFFTTKEVGKGTGLGLSVSYGIIHKFNGKIKVSSVPNIGSIFTIILPISKKNERN
ncbi:MAG: ATP-binding protein [Ignavibacteriaceae bacterium]|jgi:signal transduction histidine kinase|nr:ATP-binding protein [Ignavibacteriaceae bacterium]